MPVILTMERHARWLLPTASLALGCVLFALLKGNVPITPDEIGYLAIAKFMAGGEALNLSPVALYRSGQSLLLTPVFLAGLDGVGAYRFGVAVSCIATAIAPLVLLRIGRSLGVETTWPVIASAFVVAVLPTYLYHASMVWTEATFRLLFLAAGALVAQAWISRTEHWWIAAGATVGALYALHARALLMLPLFAVLVFSAFGRRAVSTVGAAAAIGALAIVVIGASLVDRHAHLALWGRTGGDTGLVKMMLSTLSGEGGLRRLLAVSFGQLWGLLAASYGLVAIGLASAAAMAWSRPETRPVLLFAFAAAAGVFLASVGQMISFTRIDHVIYNRYNDGASVLFAWLGLVALIRGDVSLRVGAYAIVGILLTALATMLLSRGFPLAGLVTPNIPAHLWVQRIMPIGSATLPQLVLLGSLLAVAVLALCLSYQRWKAVVIVGAICLLVGVEVRQSADAAHRAREARSQAMARIYERKTSGVIYWDASSPSPGDALMDQYIVLGKAMPSSNIAQSDIPVGASTVSASRAGYYCTALPGINYLCVKR